MPKNGKTVVNSIQKLHGNTVEFFIAFNEKTLDFFSEMCYTIFVSKVHHCYVYVMEVQKMARYTLNLTGLTLNDFTHTVSHFKTEYAEADHENYTLEKDGFEISIQELFGGTYDLTLYGPTGYSGGTLGKSAQECLDRLLNIGELNEKYDTKLIA